MSPETAEALLYDWGLFARDDQLLPPPLAPNIHGDVVEWLTWLLLGGRGAGKTRTGAEAVRSFVRMGHGRIALVAPTAADYRDVMVEGDSGLLAVCWSGDRDYKGNVTGRPLWEPSKRRLTWENGAQAFCYSGEEPDRLRGPQHHSAWLDELAAWRYLAEALDMLEFGLRLGDKPIKVITTTPRPILRLKEIIQEPTTIVTRASTLANAANLAKTFLRKVVSRYGGTRLGRQEIFAEIIEDVEGALWTRADIDRPRWRIALEDGTLVPPPDMARTVVAIDPAASAKEGSDETGIIGCGIGIDGRGYVLADRSGIYTPNKWAKEAIALYDELSADAIVYEANQGGDMVANTIAGEAKAQKQSGDRASADIPMRRVWASRGKVTRAEPISNLYEQHRVSHVGSFPKLEDQMCAFTVDFDREAAGYSPDRVDALVWGLWSLMLSRDVAEITIPASVSEGLTQASKWLSQQGARG